MYCFLDADGKKKHSWVGFSLFLSFLFVCFLLCCKRKRAIKRKYQKKEKKSTLVLGNAALWECTDVEFAFFCIFPWCDVCSLHFNPRFSWRRPHNLISSSLSHVSNRVRLIKVLVHGFWLRYIDRLRCHSMIIYCNRLAPPWRAGDEVCAYRKISYIHTLSYMK